MPFVVKNTSLVGPLDLLFPHSCRGCGLTGEVLCGCCKNHIITSHQNINSDFQNRKNIYVVGSRNGILGDLIHDYKYYSIRALARPLAELLDAILPQNLPEHSILVPLPTATHHIRARGLDHTYTIAKHLGRLRHLPVKHVLIRNKNTVQVGSDRAKRLSQADSAYTLNPKIKINPDITYILLDDIWTTGSSIKAAQKILKQAGANKTIIALLAYSS